MLIVSDCLGMEFELSAPEVILNLKDTHTAERDIKGINILGDEDQYLKMTLDPRVSFDGNAENQHMAFEFILNHTQCPIDTMDFPKVGEHIQTYISSNSHPTALKSKLIDKEKIKIPGTGKECPAVISPEHIISGITAMVHVTCACPLKNIGQSALVTDKIDIPEGISDEVKGFLFLVGEMWDGAGGADTKQRMPTMNRTSFGAIFNLFSPTHKDLIINSLEVMRDNTGIICPGCTLNDFYTYLGKLKNGKTTVEDDPTYKANENMFLGISALGDTFVQKGTEYWPIFEFRRSGNPSIYYISQYFKNIKKELDERGPHAPDFQKYQHSLDCTK
ncbi:hypothetical protein [Bacteroides uniformis]|jgi:hypothetical protein|uniref:hypothetical protein n=1 Tax=Bacteroides uniformis TaxID=820 RepID=UPI00204CDD3D|nr:MAG TPA: hypothetical protein [Caudoviricetes sp.]